jgi:hypothetical protein
LRLSAVVRIVRQHLGVVLSYEPALRPFVMACSIALVTRAEQHVAIRRGKS